MIACLQGAFVVVLLAALALQLQTSTLDVHTSSIEQT